MHWFARGRLWASREAERDDFQMHKHAAAAPRERRADRPEGAERRGSDWRPGGAHKDPRDRFKKKNRPERAWSEKDPATQRDRDKPGFASPHSAPPRRSPSDPPGGGGWRNKPAGGHSREARPWSNKPTAAPPRDRPWQTKPTGPRAQRKPWSHKPPNGDKRPWTGKPSNKPGVAGPRERQPWNKTPTAGTGGTRGAAPRGDRPWHDKRGSPSSNTREPRRSSSGSQTSGGGWSGKPRDPHRKPFSPRGPQSGGPPVGRAPRKRRDDDPDKG